MNKSKITLETLNADVDGELDAAAAAEVAKAVAEDGELARQVAALTRLRSAVSESAVAPPLAISDPRSTGSRTFAIAASIGFALIVAGSVLLFGLGRDTGLDWQARAWQMHQGWSNGDVAEQTRPAILLARHADIVPGAYVPDLSASRLSLVHVGAVPFADQQRALMAGYRGTRGCKISLLIFSSLGAQGEELSPFRNATNGAYSWLAGSLDYIIMTDSMDSDRFRLLAESVRHSSRRHRPFGQKTQTALRESREKSPPCRA